MPKICAKLLALTGFHLVSLIKLEKNFMSFTDKKTTIKPEPSKNKLHVRMLLAIFPLLIVLITLAIEKFSRQTVLFTSLISSIFLIYAQPNHPMNRERVLIVSQTIGSVIGFTTYHLFGSSLICTGIMIVLLVFLLVYLKMLHPPAVATSLTFVARTHSESDLILFGLLVLMIGLLFLFRTFYFRLQQKLDH